MAKTLIETIIDAKEVFYKNADVLVAGFLIRHPDIDPADVELVMAPGAGGTLRFSIDPKELHVPLHYPLPEDLDDGKGHAYASGWNDCRNEMIAKKTAHRPMDALVALLSDQVPGDGNG